MCGITGFYGREPLSLDRYYRAHQLLSHRGPDDEGFALFGDGGSPSKYVGGDLTPRALNLSPIGSAEKAIGCLGHLRLKIIDLSTGGHQPFVFESVTVVYNGEIYNYLELKKELEDAGYVFKTESDTEVVTVALYHWGEESFERFNGMWAIVWWDERSRRLSMSRDRFGIKPLYYAVEGGRLYFASEMKFFKSLIECRLDHEKAHQYLAAFQTDHEEDTMLDPVKQVPAAHVLSFAQDLSLRLKKYWDIPEDQRSMGRGHSDVDVLNEFIELFDSSIRLHARSDVPVGVLISGGIDSNLVAQSLQHVRDPGEPLRCYHAVFDAFEGGERDSVQECVSSLNNAQIHWVPIKPAGMEEELEGFAHHMDLPVRSLAVFAHYQIYKKVAELGLSKVLLTGHGADESYAGYRYHHLLRVADCLRGLDVRTAWREARGSSENLGQSALSVLSMAARIAVARQRSQSFWQHPITGEKVAGANQQVGRGRLRNQLVRNLTYTSLPEYLRYEDRCSMGFSRESRVPFLDYRLVEWAFRLPAQFKIRAGASKWVLREAAKGHIPERVRTDRIKKGFVTPEQTWLSGEMRSWLTERVMDAPTSCLSRSDIEKSLNESSERSGQTSVWWRLLSLSTWEQVMLNR